MVGFSKRLSTVKSPVSRIPPSQTFQSQALIEIVTVLISGHFRQQTSDKVAASLCGI